MKTRTPPTWIIRHPDYKERSDTIRLINDACSETGVKDASIRYLPFVGDAHDVYDKERYNNFLARAVYYGFSQQHLSSISALAFNRGVSVEDADEMEFIVDDIDGNGVGVEQSMKASFSDTFKHGRSGILVDFPPLETPITKKQMVEQNIHGILTRYTDAEIMNWHIEKINGVDVLTMLSLWEQVDRVMSDNITIERVDIERRLSLIDGVYTVELFEFDNSVTTPKSISKPYIPRINGDYMKYIPFFFVGSRNNDYKCDPAPMFPICDLNVAHYRNSADHEDSIFKMQPQYWAAGLNQQWYDENLKGFRFGSGSLFALPQDASCGIMQPEPNTLASEGMLAKQKAMISLGAKHLSGENSYNTATEAMIGESGNNSIVQTIINNVDRAYNDALMVLAEFMGATNYPKVKNNTDVSALATDPNMISIMVNAWMQKVIGKEDVRSYMRKTGALHRDNDAIDQDIAEEIINIDNRSIDV